MTEMAFNNVPKDMNEQKTRGIAPGADYIERDQHRLRYTEVQLTLKRIRQVLEERVERELNLNMKQQMRAVLDAR